MSEIKTEVVALAETLKGNITHAENGVLKVEADAFEKTLPEGLTMETVDAVYKHIGNVAPAFVLAAGEVSETVLKENKDLKNTSAQLKVGKHVDIDMTYDREIERRKSVSDPTMIKVQGATSVKINTRVRKSAEMSRVRASLSERAAGLFA